MPIAVFTAVTTILLLLDLGLLRRGAERLSFAEAAARTAFFTALAVAFGTFLGLAVTNQWTWVGLSPRSLASGQTVAEFFEAYLIELSLSVDNVVVISLIFTHFKLPPPAQHRVLFWGVVGAIVLRATLILFGSALLDRFEWASYVFGIVLIASALRLLRDHGSEYDVRSGVMYRWARNVFRVEPDPSTDTLMVRRDGRWVPTALVLPLMVVEATDLVFAVDSIPAVLAITRDPFIAYTSNVLAVLGMRSLYFLVTPLLARLRHLKTALVLVLLFVGVKLLLEDQVHIDSAVSLIVTSALVGGGILASLLDRRPLDPTPRVAKAGRLSTVTGLNLRSARRAVVLAAGSTLLLLGAAMMVLPGPGILTVLGGLVLLATEFAWARLWLRRVKKGARTLVKGGRS